MSITRLTLGYVPLTDAAPLIIAHEMGFAGEEGLTLELRRLAAWSQARDLLGAGLIDAAQMLVPMPVAQSIGLGPDVPAFDLVMFLSQGGQAIVVNNHLAARMTDAGFRFDFSDAALAGQALFAASGGRLRIGVPFPFSTQVELIWLLLGASGFAVDGVQIVTVPPPRMADAMARSEVDAFCVGEPWASFAIERGLGAMLLPGIAIWASPPEKGLVMCRAFAEGRPEETGALMRVVWRACQWLDQPDNRGVAAEIISSERYLNLPPELAERGLTGRIFVNPQGRYRHCPGFISFGDGAANFPWKSLAAFFASRIAARNGRDPAEAARTAMACFRTDLYRRHLRPAGAPLPGASAKVEGTITRPRMVAAEQGQMILRPDAFFDGSVFDPPFPE